MNARKNLQRFGLLILLFAFTRGALHCIPGDPIELLLAEGGTSISRESLRAELGLDRSFLSSLFHDIPRFLAGDWGRSILSQERVTHLISQRWQTTALLTGLTLLLAIPLSLVLGISAGTRRITSLQYPLFAARLSETWAATSAALPLPWLGVLLSLLLCIWIPWLELTGSLALAAITLAFPLIGQWSRLIRFRTQESLNASATLAARARGIPNRLIAWRYGFLPIAGGLVAYLCSNLGTLLAGTYVIESLFDVPGLGTLFIDAVLRRDYPVVEGCVWLTAGLSILGTAVGDELQMKLDPRLESSSTRGES